MLNMKIPQLFGMIRNDAIHLIVKPPTLRTDPLVFYETGCSLIASHKNKTIV